MQESNNVTNAMTQPQETRLIHCYDLLSFVAEIEKAVKDGFSLDFKDNTRCPVQIGYQMITTMVKQEPFSIDKLTVKVEVDTTKVEKVIKDALEEVKTLQEASESTQEGAGSQEVTKEVVEAPKRAETAAQDVKAKPGRKATVK